MTDNDIEQDDRITYALDLIGRLPDAIEHRLAEHTDLQQQLAELDGNTCTGTEHWRDTKNAKHAAKLYVIHRIDQSCPIHGQPDPGKRLRTYIGSKPGKIDQARNAIEREGRYLKLRKQQRGYDELVARILYRIKGLYWILDYIVSQTDQGIPPYPTETDPAEIGDLT